MEQPRVLVAIAKENVRSNVKQLLIRGGYYVVADAEDGFQALRQARTLSPDLVLAEADLPGMNGFELGRILANDRVAPVLLISRETFLFSQYDMKKTGKIDLPIGYVTQPLTESSLFPAIESLLNYNRYYQMLESEIKNLQEKIETRKIVERAKGILMEQLGLSEADAYRRIQKQSMDKCLPMRKVAEAIILTYDLKK
ncbi:MAG TPA: ANTAR domain-containing protein [Syntrophomonadaceae bacterium]|nr:ANTAR domain-containing protein [Syntrophomonadaceae bacterium]